MWRALAEAWRDWTGDKELERAIRAELRRGGYAAGSAQIRDVRLAAIQRPGWVQVYWFFVETTTQDENPQARRPVRLMGLSRDDTRRDKPQLFVTEDEAAWRERLDAWSEGLIRRR